MKMTRSAGVCLVSGWVLSSALPVLAQSESRWPPAPPKTGLLAVARGAIAPFQNSADAIAAGYAPANGCVSGPEEGAMGLHFVKGDLVADGRLDPMHPEALIYEPSNGRLKLVGAEYLVLADAWHAKNAAPPVLMGHQTHYVGSPNRYGIPAFYELHVWAWRDNPGREFADWHPGVSCSDYASDDALPVAASGHAHGSSERPPSLQPNGTAPRRIVR